MQHLLSLAWQFQNSRYSTDLELQAEEENFQGMDRSLLVVGRKN
jgi:hypothetical protein